MLYAIHHIGSELPKVLFKVLFWALLLAKALFFALLKVLILLLELYFAPFLPIFLVALFWALFLCFLFDPQIVCGVQKTLKLYWSQLTNIGGKGTFFSSKKALFLELFLQFSSLLSTERSINQHIEE